ncbi:MAG: amidohydrolase family protein [Gammaproteobacteria bacterium]
MKAIAAAIFLICAIPAMAVQPPLVLEHATVIDGTGTAPQKDMTLVIEGGRIKALYPSGKQPVPAGATIEDLSGRYLIPGLIDAHVHITDVEPDVAHYKPFFKALLLGGVTTVRDMAGDDRLLGYLARETNSDAFPAPDLYYAALLSGPTFFQEDKRAQASAVGDPLGFAPWMQAVSGTTDIPLAIAEAKGTGATGVKLYANLPSALVKALGAEAHRQGLRVWTHATIFPATPRDAVDAGADTISHSPYLIWEAAPHVPGDYGVRAMGDFEHIPPNAPAILALFKDMKVHKTILDATLNVFLLEAEHHPQAVGKGIMPWSYAVTKLAHEHGIPIDAGTDSAGLPFGKDAPDLDAMPQVHTEMALLVEHAGFTPIEAIQAATEFSSMAAGHGADRGTITPGKRADLVVLDADPSKDIHNTTKIDFVIKNGKIFRRNANQ